MEREPDVSVVVVSYNVREFLLRTLETLYRWTPPALALETIVVDNASADGSVEAVRARFPHALVMANDVNAGFPAANNQAFAAARGRHVFMLNPDTEFFEDALGKLVARLDRDPGLSLITPMLLNTDRTRQANVWRFPTVWSLFCETHYLPGLARRKHYADRPFDEAFEAESCSGAALLFRRDVLRRIGPLDENMFWIEDVEFCRRARDAGLRLLYYPEARIVHHAGKSAKKNWTVSITNQVFSKVKFFRKHHRGLTSTVVAFLSLYHVTVKAVLLSALAPFSRLCREKARAYRAAWPDVLDPPAPRFRTATVPSTLPDEVAMGPRRNGSYTGGDARRLQ